MVVLIKIVQVILALSILILVHEFGHFIFAKMFGIKVDKFYLFFDAGDKRLLSTKHGWLSKIFPKLKDAETDYGIGWLPLGGYCKICGMIDESMDLDSMKSEPQPWEFRSHPAWQRLLVMFGGVFFNFLLAIGLYIGILATWGDAYLSNDDNCIYVNDLAYEMGFRTGDHIISFDEFEPENFGMLQADLVRSGASKAIVLRGSDTVTIYIDKSMIGQVLNSPGMFDLAVPFTVGSVPEESVNVFSGLMPGDRIVELAGNPISYVQQSRKILSDYAGSSIPSCVVRGTDSIAMELQVDTTGRIGIYTLMPELVRHRYNFFEAIPAGVAMTFNNIGDYCKDLKLVFTPSTEAYKSVGSFIAIGQIFPSAWNWYGFVNILALLSIMLAVMNLLPIPALDGGHIVFTLYEMITGHKPSDHFMAIMQVIGLIFIFGLMFLAFGNDIMRLIK